MLVEQGLMPPGLPSCETRMFHSRLRQAAWGGNCLSPNESAITLNSAPSKPEIKAKAGAAESSEEGGGSRLLREKPSSLCLSDRKGDADDWGGLMTCLALSGMRS